MQKKVLVLVADAARARVFLANGLKRDDIQLTQLKSLIHPESQQKAAELIDDGDTGHVQHAGHAGGMPTRDPKEANAKAFAKECQEYCYQTFLEHHLSEVCLVAAPQFLGLLRSAMIYKPEQLHTLDKDYTHCDQVELATHLAKHFFTS
jgi:protein required for attachment to host cells